MKYLIETVVSISLTAEIEADNSDEALRLAQYLETPDLCNSCTSARDAGVWRVSDIDGTPTDFQIAGFL